MARVDPKPYPNMPPTSDLVYEQQNSQEALRELMMRNFDLEPDAIKGGVIEFEFYESRLRPHERQRRKAYYFISKERPLTFQWIPVSGHPPAPDPIISNYRKIHVLELLRRWRYNNRRLLETKLPFEAKSNKDMV